MPTNSSCYIRDPEIDQNRSDLLLAVMNNVLTRAQHPRIALKETEWAPLI